MNKTLAFALFLIATSALPAWAQSQKVYRCGATYSQTPCAQGVALEVQDPRTPEQKLQADQATVRDVALADTLEKDRLKAQTQAHAAAQQQARLAHPAAHGPAAAPRATANERPAPQGKKKKQQKKKEPEFFAVPPAAEPAATSQPGAQASPRAKSRKKKS